MDSVLGMLIFSAGGLAGATFLLPSRWVKGWSYETWWFVYSLVGLDFASGIGKTFRKQTSAMIQW